MASLLAFAGAAHAQSGKGVNAQAQAQNQSPQPAARPGQPVRPNVAQPGAAPADSPLPDISAENPDEVVLSAFSEPVDLSTFIELVATTLNINITIVGDVPGQVRFNAPVPVKKTELLSLLRTLLEQQGWTITQDQFGNYAVSATAQVIPNLGGDLSSTRVFRTPNIRPSSLKQAIDGLIGIPGPGPGGTARQYAYIDDLGVIIATDTPGRLDAVRQVIDAIIVEDQRTEFIRMPLSHISASVARERALQLIGMAQPGGSGGGGGAGLRLGVNQGEAGGSSAATARNLSTLYSLSDRLSVDQQGNALIFRGSAPEAEQVRRVISVIDIPNELLPRSYRAGRSASQVADIARGRGLGEVVTIAHLNTGFNNQFSQFQQGQPGQINRQNLGGIASGSATTTAGGPLMVVDEARGEIIYYGTASQQDQLKALLDQLDTEAESIVTRVYKLRNAKSEDMADIINGLITNSGPVASAPLLPGDQTNISRGNPRSSSRSSLQRQQPFNPQMNAAGGAAGEEGFAIDSTTAFVYPDVNNNQLLVKAQAGQQPEFARLIEKLDLRRPQVYIEAKIVAVTADDRLRTSFESQLINAGGSGGVFTQAFSLASYAAGGILVPPTISPQTGFTAAVIRNDMVPFVMTALANETDSRIISNPQLLVDDNEISRVVSIDRQPTSTISRGTSGQSDLVTAGNYAEAGTTLEVEPQISQGGYVRLRYEIILSSFTGEGQAISGTVLPPPQVENTLTSDSITVPSDYTVIIGGLVVENKTKTVAKIPLIGDIPLFGLLFQDRTTRGQKTVLYVFLTPKILRDPTFSDLKLLTRGPQSTVDLPPDVPRLKPSTARIVPPGMSQPDEFTPSENLDPSPREDTPPPSSTPDPVLTPAPTRTDPGLWPNPD